MIRSISKKKSFLWLLNLRPIAARKVVVHLRATGDAPILKQTKFKIAGTDKFSKVIEFLLHQLRKDTVFVYVNSAFSPGPDEVVNELYDICNNLLHHHHHHSPSTTTKKATSYSKFKKHKITII